MTRLNRNDVLAAYDKVDASLVDLQFAKAYETFSHKIIVLDDDPTGIQTVHGVSVYTDWTEQAIRSGFEEDTQMFFILTNSRAFTAQETKTVHEEIARLVEQLSQETGIPYLLISRGDSTLRGHYPLETETLRTAIEAHGKQVDGEILLPFFEQGGRLTVNDIHYVAQGDDLIPAGETEFAKDRTFGYHSSNLAAYIEEKTTGTYLATQTVSITLEEIRAFDLENIQTKLMGVTNFNKVVVNALNEQDVKIFSIALLRALAAGKHFLYRTAATFTKIIGNISTRPLLTAAELTDKSSSNGGLIMVGSHVQKTTQQLNALRELNDLAFIELDAHMVQDHAAFAKEVDRARSEAEQCVREGQTAVVYTKRERLDLGPGLEEEELKLSVRISEAVTSIVHDFAHTPRYLIAKGGITSSDIGTRGLEVKRAVVAGQVAPGVPVWTTGDESRFPHLPYIIFPGNVGTVDTLKEVVERLETQPS